MLDLLRDIFPCYLPFLVSIYEIFSHSWCSYILSDPLRAVVLLPTSQKTQIEIEPKDCIFLSKSLYIQFTTELFSTVSIPNKER